MRLRVPAPLPPIEGLSRRTKPQPRMAQAVQHSGHHADAKTFATDPDLTPDKRA